MAFFIGVMLLPPFFATMAFMVFFIGVMLLPIFPGGQSGPGVGASWSSTATSANTWRWQHGLDCGNATALYF